MKEMEKRRYIAIDFLKIFFAYIVMTHHFFVEHTTNNITVIIDYIVRLAVPFFFVTSGFFMFDKIKNNLENKNSIIKAYLVKIIFMYVAWTMMMLPFRIDDVIDIGFNVKELVIYFAKYCRIVLFIGEYQLWYLLAIVQAVIIFILTYKNNMKLCCLLAIFLFIVKLIIENNVGAIYGNDICNILYKIYYIIFGTTRNGVLYGYIYLILGCIIRVLKDKNIALPFALCVLIAMALVIGGYVIQIKGGIAQILNLFTVAAIFYCAIQVHSEKNTVFLRNVSTLVYCSHMSVILVVESFLINNLVIEILLCYCITSLVSILIIKLSYRFKLLRYFY